MHDADKQENAVTVAIHGGHALVCVKGRGTFKISPSLKRFALLAIDDGVHDFVLDMAYCDHMDSTFMGVLAGVAMRLRKCGQGRIRMINLNAKTASLLQSLGLDCLIEFCDADKLQASLTAEVAQAECKKDLSAAACDEPLTLETMLAAHQSLVEALPENAAKFTDVIVYLSSESQKRSAEQ